MMNAFSTPARRFTRRAGTILGIAGLAFAGACDTISDELLTVPDVDVARPDALVGVSALPVVLNSARGDFQQAFSGTSGAEGIVTMAGLFADEFEFAESFPTRVVWDQRDVTDVFNTSTLGIFRNLLRANATARLATERFAEYGPTDPGYMESLNLRGFTFILSADTFCSGVAFSKLRDDGVAEFGSPITRQQMLDSAEAMFNAALAVAAPASTARTTQENLARVGLARVRWGRGDLAGAVSAGATVTASFAYRVEHSGNSNREWNGIWSFNNNGRRWTVANNEGGNGLPFITGNTADLTVNIPPADPRVLPRRGTGGQSFGFDNVTPLFLADKYPARESPVVLADGREVELIRAEAEAVAGNVNYLARLNALRDAVPALASFDLTDPGTQEGRVRQVFRERALWMYLTGHRLGDLRRLVRPTAQGGYGYPVNTVYPVGPYKNGGEFGNNLMFLIPRPPEDNNPNYPGGIAQCIDENP